LTLYQLLTATGEESTAVGGLVIGLLVIMGSAPYVAANLQPVEPWREDGRTVYQFEREHPDMIAYTTWVQEKPFTTSPMSKDYESPEYSETLGYTNSLTRLAITQGVGDVVQHYSFGSRFGGLVRMVRAGTVRIHLYYFPGWEVLVDGKPALYRVSAPYGLIETDLPVGEHRIDVRMGWTAVRLVGAAVSGAVLFVVLVLLMWPVRQINQT
jgi:hypothetical protein